ncbi:MAG: NAD kinase [Bacteroidetes bacterium]|jgi:NAD+ kinase|nr:NAD kinase [Bacteroidota bacterium]
MKVAIYGRITEKILPPILQGLFDKLEKNGCEILVGTDYLKYLESQFKIGKKVKALDDFNTIRGQADFLLSLGGDGTILETIAFVRNSGIPILGVNTGRLGFLAGVTVEEAVEHAVESLKERKYSIDKRTLLKLVTKNNLFGETNFALNEFTVQRKETSAMMTIHASINGEFLNSYWADGLIVATSTGSTAYSLSCGGPLMVPDAKSFIITPLSPHNLNVRPLIVPDDSIITLKVEGRSHQHLATLDARSEVFSEETELTIRKEDFKISLIRFSDHHFFTTIREKLIWGHDARN